MTVCSTPVTAVAQVHLSSRAVNVCFLMLPYVAVLLITILISGNMGFVAFNYDSIYVWILGLPQLKIIEHEKNIIATVHVSVFRNN